MRARTPWRLCHCFLTSWQSSRLWRRRHSTWQRTKVYVVVCVCLLWVLSWPEISQFNGHCSFVQCCFLSQICSPGSVVINPQPGPNVRGMVPFSTSPKACLAGRDEHSNLTSCHVACHRDHDHGGLRGLLSPIFGRLHLSLCSHLRQRFVPGLAGGHHWQLGRPNLTVSKCRSRMYAPWAELATWP